MNGVVVFISLFKTKPNQIHVNFFLFTFVLLLFPEKITIYKLASKNFNNNKLRLQTPWCSEKMTEKSSSIPLHLLISISMVGNTLLNNRHPHSRVQDSSAAFYTSVQRIYHCAATAAKQLKQ